MENIQFQAVLIMCHEKQARYETQDVKKFLDFQKFVFCFRVFKVLPAIS